MNHKKKPALILLMLVLVLSMVLTACGGGENKKAANDSASNATKSDPSDTSQPVTLKMVLLGGKPIDNDLVFAEANKILKEKINTTVEVEYLDWSDWGQKYPLLFAADEDFDLIYTANWAFYSDQAVKGGFLELSDDMLQKYAPQTWAKMPEVSWNQAKINNKLFMVPNNNLEIINKVVLYREDLRKKYNLPEINSKETYANYLKTIASNEKGIIPFGAKAADGWKWHELDQTLLEENNDIRLIDKRLPISYKLDDATGKLFNIYETPEFKDLLAYYKDLADNGGWSKNAVTNKNDIWQDMKAGKVASYAHGLGTVGANLAEARRDKPEYEFAIADIAPDSKKISAISTQNGMGIHSTSKNPERALMLIDLLQNDKELHDLTMYGLVGTHYNPEGDKKFTVGTSPNNYTGHSNWGWNSELNRQDAAYPKEAEDIFNGWKPGVFNFALETFVFDDSKVKTEVANIGNVMVRYGIPLEYGIINDLDKGLNDLISQLKAAGLDKVQEEIQVQVDAFLAQQQ